MLCVCLVGLIPFSVTPSANKEARTKGELQTPAHFAARTDACLSLKALIKCGCNYKEVRDYKGRTPLHVAAELGTVIFICKLFTLTYYLLFILYLCYYTQSNYVIVFLFPNIIYLIKVRNHPKIYLSYF